MLRARLSSRCVAELSNRPWFDIFVGLAFSSMEKRMRDGLNEPREDFIGTGVISAY